MKKKIHELNRIEQEEIKEMYFNIMKLIENYMNVAEHIPKMIRYGIKKEYDKIKDCIELEKE